MGGQGRVPYVHVPLLLQVLLQELEQCYYCLHGHPHKRARARGLEEHNSEQVRSNDVQSCDVTRSCDYPPFSLQIRLKWDSALMLIEHYHPIPLPSIDDAKSPQVTPEVSVWLP